MSEVWPAWKFFIKVNLNYLRNNGSYDDRAVKIY